MLYPVDGGRPAVFPITSGGRSLAYCHKTLDNWRNSYLNDGLAQPAIEPVEGWPTDDLLALVIQGLVALRGDISAGILDDDAILAALDVAQSRLVALGERGAATKPTRATGRRKRWEV